MKVKKEKILLAKIHIYQQRRIKIKSILEEIDEDKLMELTHQQAYEINRT